MKFSIDIIIFVCILIVQLINSIDASNDQKCTIDSCSLSSSSEMILDYQKSKVEWTDRVKSLWDWLNSQKNLKAISFCKQDKNGDISEEIAKTPLFGPYKCEQKYTMVKFEGSYDKDMLPKGQGRVVSLTKPEVVGSSSKDLCYNMLPSITRISGRFLKGKLDGKATINYNDGTQMEANFIKGIISGKVRIFNLHNELQGVGLYQNGLPHGPFWLTYQDHYVQIHMNHGRIVKENVIMAGYEHEWATIGTLVNGTYLKNPQKIEIDWIGEYHCLQTIRIPSELPNSDNNNNNKEVVKLPIKVVEMLEQQKIMIRPSQIMYFNRVAKTGSQSFIKLFFTLAPKLGYEVFPGVRQVESVLDTIGGLYEDVQSLLKRQRATIQVRHYSFVDLERFGYDWSPDWFSLVRDPIEKVISYFYYRRASWNVVGRIKEYPKEPLPSIQFLQMDFDTCVLEQNPECRYVQDSDVEPVDCIECGGHFSQMAQFCGHDPVCHKFNNRESLERAKANVDKHYQVVGITDNMNMTLAVLEAKMPEYFAGGSEVYFKNKEVKRFRQKNNYKLPVSDEVMEIMRTNFTHEIEFYEFCKQRLQVQYDQLFKTPT